MLAEFTETFTHFCLLLIGLSLKRVLINDEPSVNTRNYWAVGVIVSTTTTILWALAMQFASNKYCWQLDYENSLNWSADGARLVMFVTSLRYYLIILRHQVNPTKVCGSAADVK